MPRETGFRLGRWPRKRVQVGGEGVVVFLLGLIPLSFVFQGLGVQGFRVFFFECLAVFCDSGFWICPVRKSGLQGEAVDKL